MYFSNHLRIIDRVSPDIRELNINTIAFGICLTVTMQAGFQPLFYNQDEV